jgi:hypothetical protein
MAAPRSVLSGGRPRLGRLERKPGRRAFARFTIRPDLVRGSGAIRSRCAPAVAGGRVAAGTVCRSGGWLRSARPLRSRMLGRGGDSRCRTRQRASAVVRRAARDPSRWARQHVHQRTDRSSLSHRGAGQCEAAPGNLGSIARALQHRPFLTPAPSSTTACAAMDSDASCSGCACRRGWPAPDRRAAAEPLGRLALLAEPGTEHPVPGAAAGALGSRHRCGRLLVILALRRAAGRRENADRGAHGPAAFRPLLACGSRAPDAAWGFAKIGIHRLNRSTMDCAQAGGPNPTSGFARPTRRSADNR